MSNILSLCEISDKDVCHCIDDGKTSLSYDTIYLGSEFCWDKLDVGVNWSRLIGFCHKKGCKAYFVFPILPERYVDLFRELLVKLNKCGIDGVVANDFGVLYYINQRIPSLPIVIGRLMVKFSRDYVDSHLTNSFRFPQEIIKVCYDFNCIRIDADYGLLSEEQRNDIDIKIGIHSVSYLTSSMCCDYKFDEKTKFANINTICKRNCLKEVVVVPNSPLIKLGNALLYYQSIGDGFATDTIIIDYRCNQLRTGVL